MGNVKEVDLTLYNNKLREYGLNYSYRAIDYMVNKDGVGLLQLRAGLMLNKKTKQYSEDLIGATVELIKIGLYGSGVAEKDAGKRAFEIAEDWRKSMGHIGILHILIINKMEKDHFFMGTGDRKTLITLSTRKQTPEIVANIMLKEMTAMKMQASLLKN